MKSIQAGRAKAVGLATVAATGFVSALMTYDGWLLISSIVFLASTLFAMALIPPKRIPFSWQFGIPAYYCLMLFALPIINRALGVVPSNVNDEEISTAFVILSGGIVSFAVGAKSIAKVIDIDTTTFVLSKIRAIDVLYNPWPLWLLIGFGVVANIWSYQFGYYGLLNIESSDISNWAGAISALSTFLIFAHTIAWTRYLKEQQRPFLVIGIASTIVLLAAGLISNSKGQIVLPFFLTALIYWSITKRFPFRQLAVGISTYLLIAYPLITSLRAGLFSSDAPDLGRKDLVEQTIEYLFSGEWVLIDTTGGTSSLGRGLLEHFAQVVSSFGTTVDYLHGETFLIGVQIFVPRFMFPDKPGMNMGNWTAQMIGALNPLDTLTNLSPTFMGEFYMNFGLVGVIIGMLFMGMVSVGVDRYLIADGKNWAMPILVTGVTWQESFIGHTILPFAKNLLLLIPIIFVFKALLSFQKPR